MERDVYYVLMFIFKTSYYCIGIDYSWSDYLLKIKITDVNWNIPKIGGVKVLPITGLWSG